MVDRARAIIDWLVDPAVRDLDDLWFFSRLIQRLRDAGIPLWRALVSVRSSQPEVVPRRMQWRRGSGSEALDAQSTLSDERLGVAALLKDGRARVRVRLERPPATLRFALGRELAQEGATDLVALNLPMSRGMTSHVAWISDRRGGFHDEDLQLLAAIAPALSLRLEVDAAHQRAGRLLESYLGRFGAERVVEGGFRRGKGQRIAGVIWMCDLRSFSQLVDEQPMDKVLRALDAYFECVGGPIVEQGGEILKLVGDDLLAVFPCRAKDTERACRSALQAARLAFAQASELNADRRRAGGAPLAFGVALHVGVITYGNVGAAGRLDFAVVGRAINEVWRVEAMCKQLGTPLLLTDAFVQSFRHDEVVSLGWHELGSKSRAELFTLRPFARG
jgi:adenylate cyclase